MSTQRGNVCRTRAQKHSNRTAFKNNLHDTSHTTKFINNIRVTEVCAKCKGVIEWKIKYKKYKPLKAPSTCVRCHLKAVTHAYHTICLPCSAKFSVCPKCGVPNSSNLPAKDESVRLNIDGPEIRDRVKGLSERRRRAFYRFVNKTLEASGVDTEKPNVTYVDERILRKLDEMCMSSKSSNLDSEDDEFDDETISTCSE